MGPWIIVFRGVQLLGVELETGSGLLLLMILLLLLLLVVIPRAPGRSYQRRSVLRGTGVVGGSLVGDGGLVSVVICHVVDDLDPAVGQGDFVGAAGDGVGALLLAVEVRAGVLVGHAVVEGVGALLKKREKKKKKKGERETV